MKKIIYFTGIIAISLVLFSCKSTKQEELLGEGETEVELQEEVENKDKDDKNQKDSEKKEEKKSEEKKDKKSKKSKDSDEENKEIENEESSEKKDKDKEVDHKGYLGWIDSNVRNPIYEDGRVKIKADSGLGTFGLFAVNEEGKPSPIISTLNEYSSSGFQLKAGRRVYKLISSKNVKASVGELSHGIGLFYDVKNIANVSVKMEAMPSIVGNVADTIKFTVEIKNTGKKTETYALKAILDTVLGEKYSYHFYDSKDMPVKREFSTRSFRDNSWFVSKNDQASMQFLIYGGDITTPSLFALANYDTLANALWEPNMISGRAFDTVLSYNNSAVGLFWPEVRLEPGISTKVVFYISLGLYGTTPTGHYFINGIRPPAKPVENKIFIPQPVEPEETPVVPTPVEPAPAIEPIAPVENVYSGSNVPNVEFNVKKIPQDHLTNEYVQSLINRIDELEQSGNPVNPNEILQLKAEIDAILSILRQ